MLKQNDLVWYTPKPQPVISRAAVLTEILDGGNAKISFGSGWIHVSMNELVARKAEETEPQPELPLILHLPEMANIKVSNKGFVKMMIGEDERVFDIRDVYDITMDMSDEYPGYHRVAMSCSGHSCWVHTKSQMDAVALYGTLLQIRDYFTGFSTTLV